MRSGSRLPGRDGWWCIDFPDVHGADGERTKEALGVGEKVKVVKLAGVRVRGDELDLLTFYRPVGK